MPINRTGNISGALQIPCQASAVLTPEIRWYRILTNGTLERVGPLQVTDPVVESETYVTADGTLVFQVSLSSMFAYHQEENKFVCTMYMKQVKYIYTV